MTQIRLIDGIRIGVTPQHVTIDLFLRFQTRRLGIEMDFYAANDSQHAVEFRSCVCVCVCQNLSMSSFFFFSGEVWDTQLKFHVKGCDMFEEDIEIAWFKAE